MSNPFRLQWYPGHMAKSRRALESRLRQVDFVIEVADARAPFATRNPNLQALAGARPRLVVLAKGDLADPEASRAWTRHLAGNGVTCLTLSLLDNRAVRQLMSAIKRLAEEVRRKSRGAALPSIPGVRMPAIAPPRVRGMVVGIPNTGKSTLIRVLGGGKAAVGDRPGVTRGVQELALGEEISLLDTPGLLWPRAVEGEVALHLAWLGYVGEKAFDPVEAALELLSWISRRSAPVSLARYGIEDWDGREGARALEAIAASRGRLHTGKTPEEEGAGVLLRDFRSGALGPLTLELPPAP